MINGPEGRSKWKKKGYQNLYQVERKGSEMGQKSQVAPAGQEERTEMENAKALGSLVTRQRNPW